MASDSQKTGLPPTGKVTSKEFSPMPEASSSQYPPPNSQIIEIENQNVVLKPKAMARVKTFNDNTIFTKNDVVFYTPIYKAAFEGDWTLFQRFIQSNNTTPIDVAISSSGKTALHVAAYSGQTTFVKKLVKHSKMSPQMLEKEDSSGHTALFFAVAAGNLKAVRAMVKRNSILPLIANMQGTSPILEAALLGQKELLLYLYINTKDEEKFKDQDPRFGNPFRGKAGLKLLNAIIAANFYDIAIDLVKLRPELATLKVENMPTALDVLARRSSSFKSGSKLNFWKQCIYLVIHTVPSYRRRLRTKTEYEEEKEEEEEQKFITAESEEIEYDLKDPVKKPWKLKKMIKKCRKRATKSIISTISLVLHWFKMFLYAIIHPVLSPFWNTIIIPVLKGIRRFWDTTILIVPGIRSIHNTKLMHQDAERLVQCICKQVAKLTTHAKTSSLLNDPFLVAAECGSADFIIVCLEFFPALMSLQAKGHTILHYCIINRQENVFKFMHHKRVDACSKSLAAYQVENGKTILHLAAELAPEKKLKTISGAALQMQHEIQWFKAVERITKPTYRDLEIVIIDNQIKQDNSKTGKTCKPVRCNPRDLFLKEHKTLLEEGEKWMRELSSSCTVVGTLITTMVFAAAITVPGGNNDEGNPQYLKNKYYMVFAISNALSLISSITSVLIFLSALTSRYNVDDFLVSLPRKVIFGLGTLFISVATMFITFISTYFIMFNTQFEWVAPVVATLISLPAILFVVSQFPLFAELLSSTYGFGLLHRKSKSV